MAIAAGSTLGRRAFLIGGVAPLATVIWALTQAGDVLDGQAVTSRFEWVGALDLGIDLRLDGFGLLMLSLVSGIGTLVFVYSLRYFSPRAPAVGRLAGLLTLFAGSMLGLVIADNLLALFLFWELTSITSYLLIGNNDRDPKAKGAAQHALLITGAGGLVLLAGLVLLGQAAGTFQLSAIVADPPDGGVVEAALVLILVGAFTKSAQVPFHSWLPSAMVAPTPISAYLHSAAMVKAGVYLIARLGPAFATSGVWRPLVVSVGLTTMLVGGLRALRAFDLKQLLAMGTVSQLGFMTVLLGIGQPIATAAGATLLVAHGAFKAALFMVVGIVDHQAHTRDIRELPTFGPGWGTTKLVTVVSAASMAGLPPLAGFLAKEEAFAAFTDGTALDQAVLAGVVAGAMVTMAYSLRLVAAILRPSLVRPPVAAAGATAAGGDGVSATALPVGSADDEAEPPAVRAPEAHHGAASGPAVATAPKPPVPLFVAPALVLAGFTVALGIATGAFSQFVEAGAVALDPESYAELKLWPGFKLPLALSALSIAVGAVLFGLRRQVDTVQAALKPPYLSAQGAYETTVRYLIRAADGVTGVAQPGSLPVYVAVILLVTAVVPGVGLLVRGDWWPGWPALVGTSGYVPVAALIIGGAVAAAIAKRRFAAALLLGATGYGMALLFVVQGAPDLALTQFGIETLTLILFLLVLRHLPDRFEQRRAPLPRRGMRLGVATAMGVFVFLLAIAASGARTEPPVSDGMVERALPEAQGRNVVNIILVDFRSLDTLGEITVLVVAAVGAAAIARAGRRPRRDSPANQNGERRDDDTTGAERSPEMAEERQR